MYLLSILATIFSASVLLLPLKYWVLTNWDSALNPSVELYENSFVIEGATPPAPIFAFGSSPKLTVKPVGLKLTLVILWLSSLAELSKSNELLRATSLNI